MVTKTPKIHNNRLCAIFLSAFVFVCFLIIEVVKLIYRQTDHMTFPQMVDIPSIEQVSFPCK